MKKPLSILNALQILRHQAEDASAGFPSLMAAAERTVASLSAGEHTRHKAGSGEKFWQFRTYDPGDRPQDIDWRQSAKGDHVYIRQKELQSAQNILFWLQNDEGMRLHHSRARYSKIDCGAIICLSLAILLSRAGENIGALSSYLRVGRTEKSLQTLGVSLLESPSALPHGPTLPAGSSVPRRSSLIFCGDFMNRPADLDSLLSAYASQEAQGLLIQVLDPAETDLPYQGRAIFRPMDDSHEITISNVPSIRKAYAEKLESHIATVREIARRHRFDHVLHVTRDDPRLALSAAWQILNPQPRLQAGTL